MFAAGTWGTCTAGYPCLPLPPAASTETVRPLTWSCMSMCQHSAGLDPLMTSLRVGLGSAPRRTRARARRYFHYVRQEMLKNFAAGTQTCGMPMTLPRLVELARARAPLRCWAWIDAYPDSVSVLITELITSMLLLPNNIAQAHGGGKPCRQCMMLFRLPTQILTHLACARRAPGMQGSVHGPGKQLGAHVLWPRPLAADAQPRAAGAGAHGCTRGLHALPGQRPVQGAHAGAPTPRVAMTSACITSRS